LVEPAAEAQDDWTRNFRVAVQLGLNIRADFKTTGQFQIGGAQIPGNREYDNGYVRVDETGNAGGTTSYWGYESPGQYDSAAQTIAFHRTDGFDVGNGAQRRDSSVQLGFDMAYGGTIKRWWRKRLGWEFGVGILPLSFKDDSPLSGTANGLDDTYHVPPGLHGPIIIPTYPYHGGPSGIGVQLNADPASENPTSTPATISGSRKLDLMFYNFRLGPTFYYDVHPRFGVSLSAGPAVGIVTGDYLFDETILSGTTTHNVGKFGRTDVVYGGYANALALVHILENGDLFAGVQFMSMGGSRFAKGGREAKLDLGSGVYFMAGVSWPF